jgi:hypothetical protein
MRVRGKGVIALAGITFLVAGIAAGPARADHQIVDLVSTGPAAPSSPQPHDFGFVANEDGRRVFFLSLDQLVAEDQDQDSCEVDEGVFGPCLDLYERFQGVTRLVSTGPHTSPVQRDVGRFDISADGTKAVFVTLEQLVAEDSDSAEDVYQREAGVTTLVSTGPTDPMGLFSDGHLGRISADGSTVFFTAGGRLVAEDQDNCSDLYARSGGQTRLVSTGPNDAAANYVGHCGASLVFDRLRTQIPRDGSHAFFLSNRPLVSEDTDQTFGDIYLRAGDSTTMISIATGSSDASAIFAGASSDGSHAFFDSSGRLVPEDQDNVVDDDLYEFVGGETKLVAPPIPGDSSPRVSLVGLAEDASRVYLHSCERLVPQDTNDYCDYYLRENGSFELVSTGPVDQPGGTTEFELIGGLRITPDGSRAFFHTTRRLVAEDINGSLDVYERANGVTHLVSQESGTGVAGGGRLDAIAQDGSRVFFHTAESLVPEDTDTAEDVYERSGGVTTLVGPAESPQTVFMGDEFRDGVTSNDGRWAVLATRNRFTADDTDDEWDLYLAAANRPPECGAARAVSGVLWPANRRLVRVGLAGVTDSDGDSVALDITGVTQDERTGSSRDAVLNSAGDEVRLRAERDNRGDGRVYRITFEATDGYGGSCSGTVKVTVPRKKNKPAQDSAPPSYDSFG